MALSSRRRLLVLFAAALLVGLVTALSAPCLAGGSTSRDREPKRLWKTYPLDPSSGKEQIERGSGVVHKSDSDKEAPTTTSEDHGSAANFGERQASSDDTRIRTLAYGAGVVVVLVALFLLARATRAIRDVAGAFPAGTVVLFVSVIFVSVMVGIGVVLVLAPMLEP